jgi:hypothetical protein
MEEEVGRIIHELLDEEDQLKAELEQLQRAQKEAKAEQEAEAAGEKGKEQRVSGEAKAKAEQEAEAAEEKKKERLAEEAGSSAAEPSIASAPAAGGSAFLSFRAKSASAELAAASAFGEGEGFGGGGPPPVRKPSSLRARAKAKTKQTAKAAEEERNEEAETSNIKHQTSSMPRQWYLLGALFVLMIVLAVAWHNQVSPKEDEYSYLETVCVTATSEQTLKWALAIANSSSNRAIRPRPMTVVLGKTTPLKKSDYDALNQTGSEGGCDRVVIIIKASDLALGRNPLYKFMNKDGSLMFLKHRHATIAIVNGTCEVMVKGIGDSKTGRLEECKYLSRDDTFLDFKRVHWIANIPTTVQVKDIPNMTSDQEYYDLLYTHEVYEDRDPSNPRSDRLRMYGAASPKMCQSQFRNTIEDEIEHFFPRFQYALIGQEGVGKSTTAFWLAHHFKTVEIVKNSFTSAKKAGSFSTTYNMQNLTHTIALSDTKGLDKLSTKFLCDIKDILDGRLHGLGVKKTGDVMKWNQVNVDECTGSRSQVVSKTFQAHAMLLLIQLPLSENDDEWENIEEFAMAMKDFKTGRSHSDLMDRIVFGIPKAPQDKIEFQRLVERMRLPRGDTFPIIAAGMDEIMIMPDMYVPIMKRLQEKACMFFRNKIENMNEKEKEIWKMSGTDFIEEDAGSWWTSILILVIFFFFSVWFISRWFDSTASIARRPRDGRRRALIPNEAGKASGGVAAVGVGSGEKFSFPSLTPEQRDQVRGVLQVRLPPCTLNPQP